MRVNINLEMDLWQEEICQEFKDAPSTNDNWKMPASLEEEDTDVPSYWHDDTSGLQDWN
jgi:hypothetical protein